MSSIRSGTGGRARSSGFYHILWTCATWIKVAQAASDYGSPVAGSLAVVASEPISSLVAPTVAIPSGLMYSSALEISRTIPSLPQYTISSAPVPTNFIPTVSAHSGIITSAAHTYTAIITITSQGNATGSFPMLSTDQDLNPIPPAATQIGDPNGHHEITEPDFTATRSCRGCSPVIQITATGWIDAPAEEQHGSTDRLEPARVTTNAPPKATISAGPATVVVEEGPDGDTFVIGDSYTVVPGQTIVIDNTPIEVRTSGGKTEVILGTKVISLHPDHPEMTNAPMPLPVAVPPVLTIGTSTIMPNLQSQYVLGEQTLVPGGEPLTISGTTVSLAPSATVLIVNGETSSIVPAIDGMYTAVVPGVLTFESQVYTANGAGNIIMGPGTTLTPGGNPVTINGTTLSLVAGGTAVAVQGTTRALQPVTTVVTLTKDPNVLGTGSRSVDATRRSTDEVYVYPTVGTTSSGTRHRRLSGDAWLRSVIVLVLWGINCVGLGL